MVDNYLSLRRLEKKKKKKILMNEYYFITWCLTLGNLR